MDRVDLSGYDESLVDNLKYLESDFIDFLERKIDRKELENRIKYVIDKFDRIGKNSK